MYTGHNFVKVNQEYVFDMTDFMLYRIRVKNGKVQKLKSVAEVSVDYNETEKTITRLFSYVPEDILDKTNKLVNNCIFVG